jgi:hypothetical protein
VSEPKSIRYVRVEVFTGGTSRLLRGKSSSGGFVALQGDTIPSMPPTIRRYADTDHDPVVYLGLKL